MILRPNFVRAAVLISSSFSAAPCFAQAFGQNPAAPAPIVYQGVVQQTQFEADERERAIKERQQRRQQEQQNQQGMQQMMNALGGMGGGAGGGKGQRGQRGAADDASGGASSGGGANDSSQANSASSDKLEPCGTPPAKVQADFQEMMEFRKSCRVADKGSNQKFAINAYRSSLGTPTMYLFDSNGECKYKTAVSYGSGQVRGTSNAPQACATNKGKYTPAGMHLTVPHPKGTNGYDEKNSLGLAGLEDQGSNARGILIHGSNSAGMGYSHGCSGVSENCRPDVMKFLGYGALVFNSFDDSQSAPGCTNTAGMKRSGTCRAEVAVNVSDASPAPSGSGGGGGGGTGGTGAAR